MSLADEDYRVLTAKSELQRLEQCWYKYLHGEPFGFCSSGEVSVRLDVIQQLFFEYGLLLERLQREQAHMFLLAQQNPNPLCFRRLIFPNEERYNNFQGQLFRLNYEIDVTTILRALCVRMIHMLQHVMWILPGAQQAT